MEPNAPWKTTQAATRNSAPGSTRDLSVFGLQKFTPERILSANACLWRFSALSPKREVHVSDRTDSSENRVRDDVQLPCSLSAPVPFAESETFDWC